MGGIPIRAYVYPEIVENVISESVAIVPAPVPELDPDSWGGNSDDKGGIAIVPDLTKHLLSLTYFGRFAGRGGWEAHGRYMYIGGPVCILPGNRKTSLR